MNNEIQLSENSRTFLENLRLYLFTSGKNSREIEDIVEELQVHLFEAEQSGKTIENIIGHSPKEYMEMISNEMIIDYQTWIKYICLIIFGSFSFTIIPDLLKGNLSYSVLEISGHIVIGIIFIASIITGFKYMSTANQSLRKQGLLLYGIAILPLALFIGMIYLNRAVDTPIIQFNHTVSLTIGIITALFIIAMSFWAKTWILFIVLLLLTLPDFLLSLTTLKHETQLVTSTWVSFGGIAIYLWISYKLEKNKQ